MATPVGAAMDAVIEERRRHPDLVATIRERILEPRSPIPEILHRAGPIM